MKTCKEFKDLILTAYLDEELDARTRTSLENHLASCLECRALSKDVRDLGRSFKKLPKEKVPASVWRAIEQKLEGKKQDSKDWVGEFLGGLRESFSALRPMPAFVSLAVLILVGSWVFQTQTHRIQDRDQGEYLVNVLGSDVPGTENMAFGTPIERYFL